MATNILTARAVRRMLTELESDYPDAHTGGLTGYAHLSLMAGVLRTDYPPKKLITLLEPKGRFMAEVNACVRFLAENELASYTHRPPSSAALDAVQWSEVVAAYNRVNNFKPASRPHQINQMAFIIAARHVGITAFARRNYKEHHDCKRENAPVYSINKAAYRRAGLSWPIGEHPLLITRGVL